MENIVPVKTYSLFKGEVTVRTLGYSGGDGERRNWTLKNINEYHHGRRAYVLPIHDALRQLASKSILAPVPSDCNAVILAQGNLDQRTTPTIELEGGRRIYRGGLHGNNWVRADGVVLIPGQSFVVSSADCPTIIALYEDKRGNSRVIATHAGRNSLLDYGKFRGEGSRRHFSVVDAVTEIVGESKMKARVWAGLSLAPGSHFSHPSDSPEYPHNRAVNEFVAEIYGPSAYVGSSSLGQYNLLEIIRKQFLFAGFDEGHISTAGDVDTYGDKASDGKPLYHSQCRDGKGSGRNLVVVNFGT